MLIFIYGQDTYRSREDLQKIIEEQEKTSHASGQVNLNWFNFVRIDAKDKEIETFNEIRRAANTVSMFNNKKLIVIENIFSAPQEIQENFLNFLETKNIGDDEDTTIVFWAEDADKKSELFNLLENKSKSKRFDLLKEAQLVNWIKDYVLEHGGKIESQAIKGLTEYVGSDLWRMSNELNKLLDYDKTIKLQNVETLIKPEIDLNIFDIVDAMGQRNKNKALKLMGRYFEKGEDEIRLLGMFVYQFRNLIKVKSSPLANPGLHPFVFGKSKEQARNFSFEELKKIYYHLLTIDFNIKFGKIGPRVALEKFIFDL